MNVLFLTLVQFESLQESNIYTDLLREFVKAGHQVYAISPVEKRQNQETHLIREENAIILRLQIGNTQKTNIIEKGISTVMIEPIFKKAIRDRFSDVKFDLVLYSTPPITLVGAIEYVKKRDGAKTYLLLKDIFPQNAVDIGMMSISGPKGFIYRHFRNQEKKLYAISDRIGCMSLANCEYLISHNQEVKKRDEESRRNGHTGIVEVCPNSIEVIDKSIDIKIRETIRTKYGIPSDKIVFIYGGNLGKPQGIPHFIECLKKCTALNNVFFLIIGDGTEYHLLEEYKKSTQQANIMLLKKLPKEDYDSMVGACDVGMIFLDHRFSIPNFPSRLLSYMQARIPVLACTDPNTDIGKTIVEGSFGWWCESNDSRQFVELIQDIIKQDLHSLGENGYQFLCKYYSVKEAYRIITR